MRIAFVVASALLCVSPALGADILRKAPVARPAMVAAPLVYNWTGFYVGAHLGGAWMDHYRNNPLTADFADHSPSSFLGGGQVGFNWQFAPNWVIGIEGQWSWTDLDDQTPSAIPAFAAAGFTKYTAVDNLGTIAARLGYVWNNWMLYAKLGWGFADYRYEIRLNNALWAGIDDSQSGWMFGLGLEYGFWNNWSVKLEYNYMDFDSGTHTFVPALPAVPELWRINDSLHVVKFGVNYRFDLGKSPVVARY